MKLPFLYAILALIATAANLGAQEAAIHVYDGPLHVVFSVAIGTVAGLATKYVLDKRYIFGFRARSAAHDARTFARYTMTGVATTLVFWGFEFAFDALFETKAMRYAGAVIGLAIGYVLKYRLDKRHVFRPEAA
jgi:putative flippase GtrA